MKKIVFSETEWTKSNRNFKSKCVVELVSVTKANVEVWSDGDAWGYSYTSSRGTGVGHETSEDRAKRAALAGAKGVLL